MLTGTAVVAAGLAVPAAPARAVPAGCSAAGLTVAALHGPNFYIDTANTQNPKLLGAYAGYRVTSTGRARSDLWVRLANFTGGQVSLGSGQAASEQVPALPGGASRSLFWYLKASAETSTAQNHDVEVWSGRPDLPTSSRLCVESGAFSAVQETIKASANKLTRVSVVGGAPRIGGTFQVVFEGDAGQIGTGPSGDPGSFWMSPAAAAAWPADAYRLVGTEFVLDGTTYTDVLRVASQAGVNAAYTATYTFRAIGPTASAAQVVPVQQIAAGAQIKHTDTGSATLPTIASPANDLTLAASAAPSPRTHATTRSCTLVDRVLRTTDVVTVTALGVDGTRSAAVAVPVSRAAASRHVLAVVYSRVDDFRLDGTARRVLAQVDATAVKYGLRTVRLVGHTDSDGSTASNDRLSARRAKQVGQWLVDHDSRVRVTSTGRGETSPAMSNETSRGKAANRRVVIYFEG